MKKRLALVALGGNALIRENQEGTIEEQLENATETFRNILFLIQNNYNLVITHGNGPQVGNILMRNHAGKEHYNIAPMPLDVCVADSQGGIGYMLERCLKNVLLENGVEKEIITLITMTIVDKNDEAFHHPVKRIGKSFTEDQAQKLEKEEGWIFKAEKNKPNRYRRVVPSPMPVRILNQKVIEDTAQNGTIVIAVGGGGVPVYHDEKGMLQPVEAVIDKDMASAMLAANIGAQELYILTNVPYIFKNYSTPQQEILEFLDFEDTLKLLGEGAFGEGSMAPKVRAALNFIGKGGEKSVITEAQKLADKKYGSKITMHYNTY